MDHVEAVRSEAVERYLLGQLRGPECEEFEEHFFDCTECAQDLRTAALFEENARAIFREDAGSERMKSRSGVPRPKPSFWEMVWTRPWVFAPAAAALVLLVAVAYQAMVVIPGLRGQIQLALAPQPVNSYVLPPLSRGDVPVLNVSQQAQFYAIYADPTWESSYAAYICSVLDDSGTSRFSVQVPSPPPGKPIQVLLARTQLPSGRYTVVVRNIAESGKPESELARYALILKLE